MNKDTKDFLHLLAKAFPKISVLESNYVPYVGTIDDDDNIESIINKIYKAGRENGIKAGEIKKSYEIKKNLSDYDV